MVFYEMSVVAAGGALGAGLRYGVGTWIQGVVGGAFPFSTLVINGVGCLVMGVLAGVFKESSSLKLFLMPGLLGGFTTFSAFSLDFFTLLNKGAKGEALFYGGLSFGLSLLLFFLGSESSRFLK
jgi:CrcB protein